MRGADGVADAVLGELAHVETELGLGALGVGLGFALGALRRRFKRAQTANFIHDSFGFELAFQPLERAIDGFSFAYGNFGHFILLSWLSVAVFALKKGPEARSRASGRQ